MVINFSQEHTASLFKFKEFYFSLHSSFCDNQTTIHKMQNCQTFTALAIISETLNMLLVNSQMVVT
jgi:hypothetical protein